MAADVTAVVVSWNTREHLARTLSALEGAADGLRVETVVVDNGSTDGSQAMVADKFPRVRLIQSPANVGFARACNVGAAAGTGRAVLLLNSDCELEPGALGVLLGALDADPVLGAVFARLLNADGTLQPSVHDALPTPWSYAGDVVFASSLRYALYRAPRLKRALLRTTLARHGRAHDVAWGGAACMLVCRKAWRMSICARGSARPGFGCASCRRRSRSTTGASPPRAAPRPCCTTRTPAAWRTSTSTFRAGVEAWPERSRPSSSPCGRRRSAWLRA
jgi:GT2 family glycosyltransferase